MKEKVIIKQKRASVFGEMFTDQNCAELILFRAPKKNMPVWSKNI